MAGGVPGTRKLIRNELVQRCFRCGSFKEVLIKKSTRFHCAKVDKRIGYNETRPSPKWCPRRKEEE